ncbi:hypothetical protein SODALDRAFT_337162 [Sodiomyces alkalinus F11]|uniref:Uncharacterized protein n=1 Tax=Sodiomyces alkalinus (strain CBS 110278 / VKM F-3762 / F11) TaxID=1314773 RepID=A0A3N2PN21_SODAK|nr:hypothetical protein SODALDRAFT_337162 [Sodiomyces alkalinus F11]ROT35915.1 hypothetical protein SODALDRAFT_337162 [Sodiomyces alkalinus F11]
MLSAPGCTTRFAISIFIACCACLFIVIFIFSESFSKASWDYAQKAQDKIGSAINKHASPTEVYNCADPYRRPGYLYIDPDDYKNTRWIPYTQEFLDGDVPSYAEYPAPGGMDVFFNRTEVEPAFLQSTSNPQQWMQLALAEDKRRGNAVQVEMKKQKAAHFAEMKDDGGLGWLWGRRVIILGDSVDRFMIQFLCEEFGRGMRQPKPHTTATCAIPTLNLTLIHWHFPGSFTYKPEWWWMEDMEEVAFEERWESMWAPLLETTGRGPTGQPDLLLWQNGLWDQRALWEAAEAHFGEEDPMGERKRQLVWQEIRFVAARTKKMVRRLSERFPDVPTMFRAMTVHRESDATDASIYELDRLSRAVAEQADHEVFEWGRIITSLSMLYKDQTHPGKGPGSWLWSNMILEYLARSAGYGDSARSPYFDGWDACHSYLAGWGGR